MQDNVKDTLNLPATNFSIRAGLPLKEPLLLDMWDKMNIYKSNETEHTYFNLHDGPPYANGHLHIGHALNKILKDMTVRSRQMIGGSVNYVPGWDCHGLPIEWKIEEQYRSKGKNKDDVPVKEFRQECRKFASKWVDIQMGEFKRLGIDGDWDNPYLTMNYESESLIAAEFHKLVMNGSLYQGSKPIMWSPTEKTSLAEAEVEHKDITSHTIWVKFPIVQAAPHLLDASVVIWTTTPWTIPSNKAIAFSQSIDYGMYEVIKTQEESWANVGERYILSKPLADKALTSARVTEYKHVFDVDNKDLAQMFCSHPLAKLDDFWDYTEGVPLIDGAHVTDNVGTGFVHTAPSHGVDDYECFVKRGWTNRMTHNVDAESKFKNFVPFFAGLEVFNHKGKEGKANTAVISKLVEANALIARGRVKHSYPHSWRSKAPIIFRNTPQWFVAIDKELNDGMDEHGKTIRQRALTEIDNVKWTPLSGKNRMKSMVEQRPDWLLSRQRSWGVPLACFTKNSAKPTDDDYLLRDDEVNKRIVDIFADEGSDVWYDDNVAERVLGGLYNVDEYSKVIDVLDVWFDSGSTHAFVTKERNKYDSNVADVYLEGTDQHRGWFQSSLLQSVATTGHAPFKHVVTHGFALDDNGKKMSKSDGNVIKPEQIIKQHGADVLRLWVAMTDYTSDVKIGEKSMKGVVDNYRKIRGTMRYILGNVDENVTYVDRNDMPELEQLMLHKLVVLSNSVQASYCEFKFQQALQEIFKFMTSDLSSFYFDIRKDALYCDGDDSNKRNSALTVLSILRDVLTKLLAPILPFTMEEIWQEFNDDSIHLHKFTSMGDWFDNELYLKWNRIKDVRSVVLAALEIKRSDKVIGSSLEADVDVYITDPSLVDDIIHCSEFNDVCIISDSVITNAEYNDDTMFSLPEVDNVFVDVMEAYGDKCVRCWKFTVLNENNTCTRCESVLLNK